MKRAYLKVRVLIVDEANFITGATRYIESLFKYLRKKKQNAYIIYGIANNKINSNYGKKGVFSYRIKKKNSFLRYYFEIIVNTYKAFSEIQRKHLIDIIHYHHTASALGILLNPKSTKIPKIYHFHGPWFLELKSAIQPQKKHNILGGIKNLLKNFMLIYLTKRLQKFCLDKSQSIIAPNKFSKKILIKYFKINPKKIIIETNNVDLKIFHTLKVNNTKKKLGFINKQILLLASRLEPRKGIQNAIRAMKLIQHTFPNTILIICLPKTEILNTEYFECKKLIIDLKLNGKVIFKRNFQKSELCFYYNLAELVIIPSTKLENCPLVALESLACATPIIAAKIGGLPEIIKPIDPSLLIRKPTPPLIASAVINYLKLDKNKKEEIKNRSLNCARNKFSWSQNINNVIKIYYRLLQFN